jgi:hypothetical protein
LEAGSLDSRRPGGDFLRHRPDPNYLRLTKADLFFHTISTAVEIWREADFFDESLG